MIRIFVFSASGNTDYLSEALSEGLSARGFSVQVQQIESADPKDAYREAPGLIGFAYPVFAWRAPLIVERFLRRMERASDPIPVFQFTTYGGLKGYPEAILNLKLKKKNLRSVWAGSVRSEDSHPSLRRGWTMPFLHKGHPDESDYKRVRDELAPALMDAYRSGKRRRFFYNPLWLPLELSGWMSQRFVRMMMGKRVNREACILCGLCWKHCPTGTIRKGEDAYPAIGHQDCTACYRCVNICPEHAFLTRWSKRGKLYQRFMERITGRKPK